MGDTINPPPNSWIWAMTLWYLCLFIFCTWALYAIWHFVEGSTPKLVLVGAANATQGSETLQYYNFIGDSTASMLVMLAGSLGGLLHAIRSFYYHHAKGDLCRENLLRYAFRPVGGAILALVFYLVFRAGLSGTDIDDSSQGILLYMAMGGMVGMFSDQTVAKLKMIARAMFTEPEKVDRPSDPDRTTEESDVRSNGNGQDSAGGDNQGGGV